MSNTRSAKVTRARGLTAVDASIDRAAERLREYERVVEGIEEMIAVVDRDYRYLLANRAFLRHRQLQRHEVIGKLVWEVLEPELFHVVKPNLEKSFAGEIVTYQMAYDHHHLGTRDLLASYFPIEGPYRVDSVACVLRDVTTHNQAVEALRQSKNELAEAQHLAHVGIWTWETDTDKLIWSQELFDILGEDSASYVPTYDGLLAHIHPSERNVTEAAIQQCRRTQKPLSDRLRIIRPDGETRTIDTHVNVVADENRKPIRMFGAFRDVTASVKAEEARTLAEQKYRAMFDNAREGIFQTTPEGRYIAANPALARMHGFDTPEELIRDRTDISRDAYVNPERREEFQQLLKSHGAVGDFEFQLVRKDGQRIWVSVNARAVRDASGNVMYYEGTAQDITERRRAQESLQDSEERYRDLVENSHEFIGTHDLQGRILSVNYACAAALGLPLDQVLGSNMRDFLDPRFGAQFDKYMDSLLSDGGTRGLMAIVTSSGDRRVWEYYNSLRTEGVSEPIVRGIARDITEKRLAEKALRESEERYRELFENSRDAIYVHDLSGRYNSVNRAAELLSGFKREEILGKHYSNFIAPRNLRDARENFCRKLDAPVETIYEAEVVCKSGRRTPVEISSRLIYRDGEAIGVQGIARDITERKRAQQALRNYSRRLIDVQEAERRNLSRELHDEIGQSLTAIRINLEWIRRAGVPPPEAAPRIDESIEVVDDAIQRVREIALELRPSLLDDLGLASALRWYVDRFSLRTGINAQVIGDLSRDNSIRHEIETASFRIVQEALTNVARHSFATRVTVNISQRDDELTIEVSDNGLGFEVEEVLHGGSSPAAALGLRGMQERALAVNGQIDIVSQPRAGTRIMLGVPLIQP